jgi:hypothetical protein
MHSHRKSRNRLARSSSLNRVWPLGHLLGGYIGDVSPHLCAKMNWSCRLPTTPPQAGQAGGQSSVPGRGSLAVQTCPHPALEQRTTRGQTRQKTLPGTTTS